MPPAWPLCVALNYLKIKSSESEGIFLASSKIDTSVYKIVRSFGYLCEIHPHV